MGYVTAAVTAPIQENNVLGGVRRLRHCRRHFRRPQHKNHMSKTTSVGGYATATATVAVILLAVGGKGHSVQHLLRAKNPV